MQASQSDVCGIALEKMGGAFKLLEF